MGSPQVSIGLPVYNGARFVAATIDSILGQTYGDFELVISDNASDDGTSDICRAYADGDARVQYSRNERNIGAAANFNRTFQLSTGNYFKWTGHDDVYSPVMLEKAVQALDEHPEAALCYWQERMIDGEGKTLRSYTTADAFQVAGPDPVDRFSHLLWHTKMGFRGDPIYGLIRADVLRETRLLSAGFQTNWLLMQELSLLGTFLTIPEQLAVRRYNNVRTTAASLISWLRGSTGRVGFPHFRHLFDYYHLVKRSKQLSDRGRRALYVELAKYFAQPSQMRGFVRDLTVGRLRDRRTARQAPR